MNNLNLENYLPTNYYKDWLLDVRKNQIGIKFIIGTDTDTLIRAQKQIITTKQIQSSEVVAVPSSQINNSGANIITLANSANFIFKDDNCNGFEVINPLYVKTQNQIFIKLWTSAEPIHKFLK